jgi:hypothetical protein
MGETESGVSIRREHHYCKSLRGKRVARYPEIRRTGATTLRDVADALNARGIATARGGRWHATTVRNVLLRETP